MLALPAGAATDEPGILVSAAQGERIRQKLDEQAKAAVRQSAAEALKAGPWSVTNHRPENVTAGPNDYYSEGPYWWPDPKHPKGPYIRKGCDRGVAATKPATKTKTAATRRSCG